MITWEGLNRRHCCNLNDSSGVLKAGCLFAFIASLSQKLGTFVTQICLNMLVYARNQERARQQWIRRDTSPQALFCFFSPPEERGTQPALRAAPCPKTDKKQKSGI
jgi:hypothetical protein